MEDGKCLLDVINDPNALKDFLRTNSQIQSSTHDNGLPVSSNLDHVPVSAPQVSQQSFLSSTLVPKGLPNSNHSSNLVANSLPFTSTSVISTLTNQAKPTILPTQSLTDLVQRTPSNPVNVVRTVGATIPSDAMQTSVNRPAATVALLSGSKTVTSSNLLAASNTAAVTAAKQLQGSAGAPKKVVPVKNNVVSTPNVKTNVGLAKTHSVTPVAIQAKKPIPIQPKNPALMPQPINIQAQSSSMLKGLQYFANTSPVKQAAAASGQQSPFPVSTAQFVMNGVNTAQPTSSSGCLQSIRTQAVPQVLLSPSQKRLAPKQQPLLSQAVLSSPQQSLQQTLQQSQERILKPNQSVSHTNTQSVFVQHQSVPQLNMQQKHVVMQQNSAQPLQSQNSVIPAKQSNTARGQLSQAQQILNLVQEQHGSALQVGGVIPQSTSNTGQMPAEHFKNVQQLNQVQLTQQQNGQIEQQQPKAMLSTSTQGAASTSEGTTPLSTVLQNVQQKPNLLIQQQFIKTLLDQKQQQPQSVSQLPKINQDQLSQQQLLPQQQKFNATLQQQQQQQSQHHQQQIKLPQTSAAQPVLGLDMLQQQKLLQQLQQQLQQKAGQSQMSGAQQVLQQQQQKVVVQVPNAVPAQSTAQPNQVVIVTSQSAGVSKPSHLQQMMDQQQRQLQEILGQQQVAVQQQQKVVIANQPVLKTAVQTSQTTCTSTQQTTKVQQQNSTATGNTLQKVFIIKQPQVLQKLGMQGIKPQQTVQITPQQLQVLKQFQQQQQLVSNSNNKLPLTMSQTGVQQTTVITQQQLKKLQLQLQQQQQSQGPSVIKQALSQTQPRVSVQQRQALDQQLQPRSTQQQGNTKVLVKQLPRILQTSGRQPVNQGGVTVPVPRSSTVGKLEASKGLKRPHSEISDVPKAGSKFKQVLGQDQQGVLHPVNKPFASYEDGIKKLARYHLYHDPGMSGSDIEKSEALFTVLSNQLMRRSQKMMEKYRHLLYDESMRQEPSAEMVMLYRVFLADERASLATEKKQAKESNLNVNASTPLASQCSANGILVPTSEKTNTITNKLDATTDSSPTSMQSSRASTVTSVVTSNRQVATSDESGSVAPALSSQTKSSSISSSTNSSSGTKQQVDSQSTAKTTLIAPSAKSTDSVNDEKDETERTLEILDSILADLANQSG